MDRLTGVEIAWAAQLACLFEVSVEKPGNVSPRGGFIDARFEDFATSAVAIGPALRDAGLATVGETIARAAADTRRLVATNTNLGMILLLAPLARAAARLEAAGDLRAALGRVLADLTVQDARLAYEAIRAASPAGMGEVDRHDVGEDDVTVTLREAMDAARERDSIAREYVTDFEITFALGAGTLRRCWEDGAAFSDAVVTAFLTILAEVPDTLIARKNGAAAAEGRVAARGARSGRRRKPQRAGARTPRRAGARARRRGPRAQPGYDRRPCRCLALRFPDGGRDARRRACSHGPLVSGRRSDRAARMSAAVIQPR